MPQVTTLRHSLLLFFLVSLLLEFAPLSSGLNRLQAQVVDSLFVESELVAGDFGRIVSIEVEGSDVWVAEKSGRIRRVETETGSVLDVAHLDGVFQPDEWGVYSMVTDPSFPDSPYVYIRYPYQVTYEDGSWNLFSRVVRLSWDREGDTLVDPFTVLDSITSVRWNTGGGMAALENRTLLVASGDGINFADQVQKMENTRGKLLRVNLDGSIPADNPFPELAYPLNTVVALGFHNPVDLMESRWLGTSTIIDLGTTSLDEINTFEPGANYGWEYVLGKCDGHPNLSEYDWCGDSLRDPWFTWYKAEHRTAVPNAMIEYDADRIAHWKGSFMVATEKEGLHQLIPSESLTQIDRLVVYRFSKTTGMPWNAFRDLSISDAGELYGAVSSEVDGTDEIVRIVGSDVPPPAAPRPELSARTVLDGLRVPWEIEWGFDNTIWMTERGGTVSRIDPETGDRSVILSLEPASVEATGLLGMALHPAFCDSPFVYLVYTYTDSAAGGGLQERLSRFRYEEVADTLLDEWPMIEGIRVTGSHAGSRVAIGRDRKLYMTVSDADRTDSVQTVESLLGSILRMNLDGSSPSDNPFRDQGFPAEYIWSFGHRNAQGLVIAPDGTLYSSEHGPWTDDEVNRIEPGQNYGWAEVLGYCDTPYEERYCEEHHVTEPMIAWTPTIAPAGLDYYDSDAIPEWTDNLLLVTLKTNRLMALSIEEKAGVEAVSDALIFFPHEFGRLRDLCVAPDGRVFITTSNHDGVGVPRPSDDRLIEISSVHGHPDLPAPGALCDTTMGPTGTVAPEWGPSLHFGNVYPMPVDDRARIDFEVNLPAGELSLYRNDGRLVLRVPTSAGSSVELIRGDLPAGFYVVQIEAGDGIYRYRVLFM